MPAVDVQLPAEVGVLSAEQARELGAAMVGGLRIHGVRPGDWVALAAPNSIELLAAVHGCLLAGIAPLVLSSQLTDREQTELLRTTPVKVVADLRLGPPQPLGTYYRCRPVHVTSGTTGLPKPVWSGWHDEATAQAVAQEEADVWGFRADDVHLVAAPLSHSAPLRFALNTLLAGGSVIVLPRFEPDLVVAVVEAAQPSTTFFAPAHLQRLLDHPAPVHHRPGAPARRLDGFRLVAHAGSPCPMRVKLAALAAFPPDTVVEFYGSTEAQFTVSREADWRAHPDAVGRARPGRSLRVGDDGRVWVRLPAHARFEYYGAPPKTAAAWQGDWFTAGDLGRIDEQGYLTLQGRNGDLIITGGVNVYPAEVERALLELPGVSAAVVFGQPDERWGERVCAVVEGDVELAALDDFARERLAPFKRPKHIRVCPRLPRTHSGKIDRSDSIALTTREDDR